MSFYSQNDLHQPTRHKGLNEKRTTLTRGRLDAFVLRFFFLIMEVFMLSTRAKELLKELASIETAKLLDNVRWDVVNEQMTNLLVEQEIIMELQVNDKRRLPLINASVNK